ncbi:MAG: hypothetical protein AAB221_14230 [Bacteroidota bacterium]
MNDIGRALVVIHEGVHANESTKGTVGDAYDNEKQHSGIVSSERATIVAALTEYNDATGKRLDAGQIELLSYGALLNTDEGKAFVIKYAQDNLGVTVTDENKDKVYKDNVGKVTNAIQMLMYNKSN